VKILLIRFSSFGDVVFTLPLAAALKAQGPGTELAWAIEEPLRGLIEGARFVDRILPARTRIWRHGLWKGETRREISGFLRAARSFAPDLIVDAQGLFKSGWATFLIPAPRKIGFGPGTATERVNCLSTREWVEAPGPIHAIDRMLSLATHLTGRAVWDRTPDVRHLVERPDREVDLWLDQQGESRFALLQPWSSKGPKEWGEDSLLAVSAHLRGKGVQPVVKWGPVEEQRALALAQRSQGLLRLAPRAGAAATARLAARAGLFVGADSGPTHLAAAAGTPTLALFGPTEPSRFGPAGPLAASLSGPGRALPSPAEIIREVDRILP
jgi:lipopolysaccharide heptosyltransferase I